MSRNKNQARIRESELYRNAGILFNKNGYASTSIRQICKAIGIKEGSIYYYIKKKEDILYNICKQSMLRTLEAIKPVFKSDLRCDLKLQRMIETHITTIAEDANLHSTMLKELRSLSPSNQKRIIKLRDQYETMFRDVIAECVDKRLFRDLNVKFTTLAILGMMNWLIHWYLPDGEMKKEDIAKIFSDIFLKGPMP